MQEGPFSAVVWVVAIVVVAFLFFRQRSRRGRVGAGAAGGVYDWLNEEKRRAVEIVVEERASVGDPEHRDGDLPQLEHQQRRTGRKQSTHRPPEKRGL